MHQGSRHWWEKYLTHRPAGGYSTGAARGELLKHKTSPQRFLLVPKTPSHQHAARETKKTSVRRFSKKRFFLPFFSLLLFYIYIIFFYSQTLSVAVSLKQGCQGKLRGPFQGTGFQTSEAGGKGFKNKQQELAAWGWGWFVGFFCLPKVGV